MSDPLQDGEEFRARSPRAVAHGERTAANTAGGALVAHAVTVLLWTALAATVLWACASQESSVPCGDRSPGVLLSFDDYSPSWEEHRQLLRDYGVRATFFVTGDYLLDPVETARRFRSLSLDGHVFGVHTISHRDAPSAHAEDPDRWLREDVLLARSTLEEALGMEVVSFAYPYGSRTDRTDEVVAQHFAYVRTIGRDARFYGHDELESPPVFLFSTAIDNVEERSRDYLSQQLQKVADSGCLVWPVTSHAIGTAEYAITEERLTWIFERARELQLRFFIPEDFLG